MHINSLTLCPLTDGLIFKDRLDYSTTSPSTSSSTEFSSRHPERKATAADKSNSPSDTCNSFSLEAAFDSRFDINFDLKMNHQYHSPPSWKSTHQFHDDDNSQSKTSNSKVRGVSSSRRPQTPPASNVSRPSSPGGNSFLSRQYEMMGKKTPIMLAASLRRPLFGKDGLRYGSDDDQRLEEDHHVAVDDNYDDDDDVDEYHHRSHSRPSGSRRGSLKEFFRRGSQELVHAADIIVAPKRDREAWITEENARLEKEFQMQLEKEKEKEKARLVVLPPPPPLPLKVKRNAAEPRHHRHPRAAGISGPTTTTPPPPARPTPPPRSKGLTRGEDFAIFISRAVDPLKSKKNQGRSRKDSSDSLTCLDAVVVDDDTPDEYARCDGCKMVNCSAARPLKYGLCESCWNVRFVKAPREGNWI